MRTIAIINQKGGCGKTTCSINLAAVLARQGRKTLLVDMDPQSHCALGLAVPEAQIDRSTADMLRAGLDGSVAISDITWQISRNLDLAPSNMALAAIEQQLGSAPDKDRRLAQVLSTVQDLYEYCIIDCPPSIGLLTFNALRAADEVIIPVETGYFAMQGSIRQAQTVQMLARRVGHNVRFSVLPTMYDVRTKLAREILNELKRQFGEQLMPLVINFNAKLKEAASFGQPITEYDPASRGMQDFEHLAAWLIANPPVRPVPVAAAQDAHAVAAGAQPAIAEGAPTANPAMSRAAELVERARALAARTAQISSKLARDPDNQAEGIVEGQPMAPAAGEPVVDTPPQVVGLEDKLARLYGVRQTSKGLLFVQPGEGKQNLAIAGDFNNWNPDQTPMKRDDNLGVWQTCIQAPPGRYRYRLVVDGEWVADPYNEVTESNPFGEINNVVEMRGG